MGLRKRRENIRTGNWGGQLGTGFPIERTNMIQVHSTPVTEKENSNQF